jgi:hypothetical protein
MIIKSFWIRNNLKHNKSFINPKVGIYSISATWYFYGIIWVLHFVSHNTSFCPHMKIPCYMHHLVQQIMALITNSYMDGWICVLALLGL